MVLSRMHADAVQHFVLDDVADAREHVLVEQRVGGQRVGMRLQISFAPRAGFHVSAMTSALQS